MTHAGMALCDEEELGEGSVNRQQHSDTGGILAQAVLHGYEELPQRAQQRQLTGPAAHQAQKLSPPPIHYEGLAPLKESADFWITIAKTPRVSWCSSKIALWGRNLIKDPQT